VVAEYNQYLLQRLQKQCNSDLVSVVQFDSTAHIAVQTEPLFSAPKTLGYRGGGTQLYPAAECAVALVQATPASYIPVIVFMSDGEANDAHTAAPTFQAARAPYQSFDLSFNNLMPIKRGE